MSSRCEAFLYSCHLDSLYLPSLFYMVDGAICLICSDFWEYDVEIVA